LWRVWSKKGTPLQELREEWTYPDLLKANAILEMEDAFETGMETLRAKENKA
jgi:hypothetical protein